MKNVHLSSVMIPALPGIYLTANYSGCITREGRPSIRWSLTNQNGIGEITREEPISVDMARTIHQVVTGRQELFDVLVDDLQAIIMELNRTDSITKAMRMAFANHMVDS